MMSANSALDLVTSIVELNGARLVGKTRFQKTMYILQKLGLPASFDFDYHYYGPYAPELADVIGAAVQIGRLSEKFDVGYHGTTYSIFTTEKQGPDRIGDLPSDKIAEWLKTLGAYTGTDLELASTILYLRDERGVPDDQLKAEVMAQKPVKATAERLTHAWRLLDKLGLSEARAGEA